jgi:uncharacterized protein YoxC
VNDPVLLFGMSLIIVIVFLIYIYIRLSKFSAESHHVFASARSLTGQIEEQDKEIFHQNEELLELVGNDLNQVAVINNLLTKIQSFLEEDLADDNK